MTAKTATKQANPFDHPYKIGQEPRSKLIPTALYLGDNGRCFCGNHAGATAQASGRDLSGQRVHRITDADQAYARTIGAALACERCTAIR